jgi:hypothetical protein
VDSLLAEIHRRDRLLSTVGWANLGLAFLMFFGLAVDGRVVLGINPWIKPLKFAVSIAIYVFTVALLLDGIRSTAAAAARWISRGVALSMSVEIVCIAFQSARGVPSHFNHASTLDAAVFNVMGLMIALNTFLMVGLLALYARGSTHLSRPVLWGVRLGLVLFLAGSAIGGLMIARNSHAVGAPDGGPGLPFLNWSTDVGDLRPAHALGLHALQILPLVGWAASRVRTWGEGQKTGTVIGFALAYLIVAGLLLHRALAGRPLLAG